MLTSSQKDYLYQIIVIAIGEDSSIKAIKKDFNERTVVVAEQMIAANYRCNDMMKTLFEDLLDAATGYSRGWLKKVLNATRKNFSATELDGYGCRVISKSKWKAAIIISTI